MHGSSQGLPVPLTTLGGLVTLAGPESLPEGASPRCYDNDYSVGSTMTRAGLTSVYSFAGASAGPDHGGYAADIATGGVSWSNPGNTLVNTGVYATATLASSASVLSSVSTGTTSGGGVAWTNPENIDSVSAFASVALTAGGTNYNPSVSSGSVSNVAGPSNQSPPENYSASLGGLPSVAATAATLYVEASGNLTAYQGGGAAVLYYSIDSGATWLHAQSWSTSFTNAIVPIPISTGLTNLNTIKLRIGAACGCSPTGYANVTGSIATWYATVAGSVQLSAQTLSAAISGLAVPSGATITGLSISFNADYAGAAPSFMVGLSVGNVDPAFALTTSPAIYYSGGIGSMWGYSAWTNATLASLSVNFFASAAGTSTVNVNTLKVTVYYSSTAIATDGLAVEQFGFSVPSTVTPLGFTISVRALASSAGVTLYAQMLRAGIPVGVKRSIPMPTHATTLTFGGNGDLFGAGWAYSDLNATNFGVQFSASGTAGVVSVGYTTLACALATSQTNFDFITSFAAQDGSKKNLLLDANGNLWVEDVSNNPGVLNSAATGITPNALCISAQGPGVEYLAFSDGFQGIDIPRQYTPEWIDRITQAGPGASPVFAPVSASSDTYTIATITQPAQKSDPGNPGHFEDLLWSQGPTSTTAGNVVTVFYALSTSYPQDSTLVNAFNSGQTVYVYMSGLPAPYVDGTYQVTSVGKALTPGGAGVRWYFTYQMPTVAFAHTGGGGETGFYQQTLATMTTTAAVPGLSVGGQVTITGASSVGFNNTWTITQTLNSGEMAITQTAVASGVATYTYSLSTGVAPVAGQLVTITGTTNANGGLNAVNAAIVTATGGSSGSFTLAVSLPNAVAVAEQGQATTAGTQFCFDPGLLTLGTVTNPIYGNSAGGSITFSGVGEFIGSGTRQGVVFFITRNGYYTAPSPPVEFTCPANTIALAASQIPIGPPNVIARGIALTEAGQNGVPGANFFTIPTPVNFTVANVPYTANALIINDNTTTSGQFFFTDSILLSAEAIDVYGFNLFNQIEIGNPGWIVNYDSRNFYGLCQNKIQNFNNLSFDGGYIYAVTPVPLGWTAPDIYGSLLNSPVFGNSYYIKNTSGATLATAGLISQTAYQDAYQQPVLNANTAYSVRVTARVPSGLPTGNLVITLTAGSATYGTFTLPFGSMLSTMATYTGTLLVNKFPTVPDTLTLNVCATAIANNADVEIDRVEVFPTEIPILGTVVFGSYAGLPEQVDAVTGAGQFVSENQQPVNGAVVMYDTLYGLKGRDKDASMYSWQSSPDLEPADWNEPEVAQRAGACGPLAFDFGEQWIVEACRNGIYLFEGGQPGKIMQEIYQVWDALNWQAEETIWVRNDVTGRRLFIGVPLPTPNFWLPDAPVNAAPTSPNVILMCNYQGLDTGQEIKASPGMHTTMFGSLNAIDMRRKWSIWQIASPYAAFVNTATDKALYICNGAENSKVYMLDAANSTDDGAAIDSLYTTYGFPGDANRKQMPAIGDGVVRIGYMNMTASGSGNLQVRFLPNVLLGPGDDTTGYNPWTVPGGFNLTPVALWNRKASVNVFAERAFVEVRGADFNLSWLSLTVKKDTWNAPWGVK